MVDVNSIRDKIQTVMDNADLNRSIEINRYSVTHNQYGDIETTFQEQEIVNGIVKDYNLSAKKYDPTGKFNDSSAIILLTYDITIDENDTVVFGNDEYIIQKIQGTPLGELNVYNQVFVKKKTGN